MAAGYFAHEAFNTSFTDSFFTTKGCGVQKILNDAVDTGQMRDLIKAGTGAQAGRSKLLSI